MSSLKGLYETDEESRLIASGYIRSKHKSLFKSNTHALFQNIPIPISLLCALYYYTYDQFLELPPDMDLTKDEETIGIANSNRDCFSFGELVISSTSNGVYRWNLRVLSTENHMRIGIMSSPWNVHRSMIDLFVQRSDSQKFYLYCPTYGRKPITHEDFPWDDGDIDSKQLRDNDIVCMELNLRKKSVRFYINNEDRGIVCNRIQVGKDIQYRLAVSLVKGNPSMSIIKFTEDIHPLNKCELIIDFLTDYLRKGWWHYQLYFSPIFTAFVICLTSVFLVWCCAISI